MSKPQNSKLGVPKKQNLYNIKIQTEKKVTKVCNYKTRIGAGTLEEAHKLATEKAAKMHESDPESNFFVVEVSL